MIPLYRRLLGDQYNVLPDAVQELHQVENDSVFVGTGTIHRGKHPLARIICRLLQLPPERNDVPLQVTFKAVAEREIWIRDFGGKLFTTSQWHQGNLLYERLNSFTLLIFSVAVSKKKLKLNLEQVNVFGMPLISLLKPKVIAEESQVEGKFHFYIHTALPVIGLLVRYSGYLVRLDP